MKRALCLILFALAGCLDAEPMAEVRILGEVRSNQTGPIELWLMHQSYGKGPLKTQLAIIGTLILDEPGPIDWQFWSLVTQAKDSRCMPGKITMMTAHIAYPEHPKNQQ